MTPSIANDIEILWNEDIIRLMYKLRAKKKIDHTSSYFLDNVQRIAKPDYIPTHEDLLNVRYRTTGVVDYKFNVKKRLFHLWDVGGQRSERKKWHHIFTMELTAVIFVVALSCYDEVMFEDYDVNMMVDQVELFEKNM